MRFHVPQFIDVKNKIFGPLTIQQFLYLAGGGGLSVIIWFLIPYRIISIILIVPIVLLALALAFYKINEKPFIEVLEAAFYYAIGSKLFIWQRQRHKPKKQDTSQTQQSTVKAPAVGESKLKDLTWSLDVSAGAEDADEENPQTKETAANTQGGDERTPEA